MKRKLPIGEVPFRSFQIVLHQRRTATVTHDSAIRNICEREACTTTVQNDELDCQVAMHNYHGEQIDCHVDKDQASLKYRNVDRHHEENRKM